MKDPALLREFHLEFRPHEDCHGLDPARPSQGLARTKTAMGSILPPPSSAAPPPSSAAPPPSSAALLADPTATARMMPHGATAVRQSVVKQALNAVMRPWSLQGEEAWPDERHAQTKRVDSIIPPDYGPDKHKGSLKKATARRPSQGLARTKTATGMIMPPQPAAAHGGQLGGDPTAQPQAALQAMTQPAMPQITPGTFTTPAPQAAGAGGPGASVVPGQGNSPASNPINHYGALS